MAPAHDPALSTTRRPAALRTPSRAWPIAPAALRLLGAGGMALAAGLPAQAGAALLADGSAALLVVHALLYRRQHDAATAVEALAAVAATGARPPARTRSSVTS